MRTLVVSSLMTLAVKYIFPAMLVGISLPLLIFMFSGDSANYAGAIPLGLVRILLISFLISLVLLWRATLRKLLRAEIDTEYLYVSNYFDTVRYTYDSIERIDDWGILFFNIITVHLNAEGRFGKKLRFWAGSSWQDAIEEVPSLRALLTKS